MIEIVNNEAPPLWLDGKRRGPKAKYPLERLEVGQSMRIPVDARTIGFATLVTLASRKGRRMGRKFRCHERADDGSYEVYREE